MKKILIIDSSHMLTRVIRQNIEEKLNILCKEAHTLEDAKQLIERNRFFMAISGVVLPGAENGEVIHHLDSHAIPTIVLSSGLENQSLIGISNVIEFKLKEESGEIDHLIESIRNLHRNQRIEVLVSSNNERFFTHISEHFKKMHIQHTYNPSLDNVLQTLEDIEDDRIKLVLLDNSFKEDEIVNFLGNINRLCKNRHLFTVIELTDLPPSTLHRYFRHGLYDYICHTSDYELFSFKINNILNCLEKLDTFEERYKYDNLTGLYTLSYLYENCETSYSLAKEEAIPSTAAVIGIDNLTMINKTHGYIVGNRIIQTIAKQLIDLSDESTIAARFGGDTFVLLDFKAKESQLQMIYEAICSKFSTLSIECNGKMVDFTVSVGVNSYFGSSLVDMVETAYSLLIKAKHDGKNRVVVEH